MLYKLKILSCFFDSCCSLLLYCMLLLWHSVKVALNYMITVTVAFASSELKIVLNNILSYFCKYYHVTLQCIPPEGMTTGLWYDCQTTSPSIEKCSFFVSCEDCVVIFVLCLTASVSGFSVVVSILTSGGVCVLYTSLGGMKAVVWTDTLQMCIIFLGLIILPIMAICDDSMAAPGEVLERIKAGNRLHFGVWVDDRILKRKVVCLSEQS